MSILQGVCDCRKKGFYLIRRKCSDGGRFCQINDILYILDDMISIVLLLIRIRDEAVTDYFGNITASELLKLFSARYKRLAGCCCGKGNLEYLDDNIPF